MKFLLDTHILLWAATQPDKLSTEVQQVLLNPQNTLFFSAASIWEISIKRGLNRPDFRVDPRLLRRGLRDNQYQELDIQCEHSFLVENLPPIHKDPFDRILIAQAMFEGLIFITADQHIARYPISLLLNPV